MILTYRVCHSMTTIREMVLERQSEIAKGNLTPSKASELLVELSALLGNCNEEITKRDIEYNKILLQWLETEAKASHAKIKAECTSEYLLKRQAHNTRELVVELIRSLKYFLRNSEEEYRQSGN